MSYDITSTAKDVVSTSWDFQALRSFKHNLTGRLHPRGDRKQALGLNGETVGLVQHDNSYKSIWVIGMSKGVL